MLTKVVVQCKLMEKEPEVSGLNEVVFPYFLKVTLVVAIGVF